MSCRTRKRHLTAFLSALVYFGRAGEGAGQTPGPTPSAPSTAADFDALVKKGDHARIAGNWSVALEAYAKALERREDPLVAGRVGLVLNALHEYEAAAGKLFHAIERSAGIDYAERTRFFQAFVLAQKQTCRLDVTIVQTGVKLEIDGETRFAGRREGWTFVKPGKRTVHASLEGFEDQTIEIDAPKGGQVPIKIELRPVKPPEEPAKEPEPEPASKATDPPLHGDKPAAVVIKDKPTAPTNPSWKNGSFVVGIGAGFVFGATPTPAMGPHAFIAWRSRSWWEVGVEGRVAATFVEDERFSTTQFVTWSAMVTPCGRWWKQRLLTCGLVQVDGAQRADGGGGGLLPAFGVRGGLEFGTHQRLSLQLAGDLAVHYRGFTFQFPETNDPWTGSIVTGTLGLRAVIKP